MIGPLILSTPINTHINTAISTHTSTPQLTHSHQPTNVPTQSSKKTWHKHHHQHIHRQQSDAFLPASLTQSSPKFLLVCLFACLFVTNTLVYTSFNQIVTFDSSLNFVPFVTSKSLCFCNLPDLSREQQPTVSMPTLVNYILQYIFTPGWVACACHFY